ncbi:MAG: hypothetical protein LUE17_02985 [Planctomycetaceae bacterium]|nr:hypothetical protein [Planctomycetaceae bacterium]
MFLDDAVRTVQGAVEQRFLFRKIGLPFDYASDPEDFPSKAFATAKEARANQPNQSGLGGGYHFSCRNHALLFDSYLLRIETGIEAPGDDGILDRLIGGLIRLATVAPKSFLVGGLAPDGRGFYAQPRRANHAAWSFAVNRGLTTAAIAPESQEKFRSIAGKWMDRIRREKFKLHSIDGKALPNGDLSQPEPENGPLLLAMLLTAARASGEGRDFEAYEEKAEEGSRARFGVYTPEGGWAECLPCLMWRSAVWSILAESDPNAERSALAKERLAEAARLAVSHVGAWRQWNAELTKEPVDFNWRTFPKADTELGFTPPPSWARLDNERHIEDALSAAYTVLLAGDRELAEPIAGEMEECLQTIPWADIVSLTALAPVIGVHARGVEMDLWDKALYESRREPPSSEVSFAARYLEPDYDSENPDKAGHAAPPPGKQRKGEPAKEGGGKKRRRRKKR